MLGFGRQFLGVVLVLVMSCGVSNAGSNHEVAQGAGPGSFNALSGEIYGLGESPELGDLVFSGAIELKQVGDLLFEFQVETNLADVQGLPNDPVAPFTFDFKGFISIGSG